MNCWRAVHILRMSRFTIWLCWETVICSYIGSSKRRFQTSCLLNLSCVWNCDPQICLCCYCKDFLLFLLDIEVRYNTWVVWELWYFLELAILTDVVMSGKTMLYYVLCYLLSANALGTWQHFSDDFFCVLEKMYKQMEYLAYWRVTIYTNEVT